MPSASVGSPTAQAIAPTTTPSPQDEVLAAYLRYWEAYGRALLDLDPALVRPVATGDRLQQIQEEIQELKRQGLAARVHVTHNPAILEFSDGEATIYDEMVNNSFVVDMVTKQPGQGTGTGELIQDTYRLRRVDGAWKVVDSSRLVVP